MANKQELVIRLQHLDQHNSSKDGGEAHLQITAHGESGRVTGRAQLVYITNGPTARAVSYMMFQDFGQSETHRLRATQKHIDWMFSRWTSDEKKAELLAAVDAHYSKMTAAA